MEVFLDFIDDEPELFFGVVGGVLALLYIIWMTIVLWKIFNKAKVPGWGCLIPIYNLYLLVKIAKRPDWWLIFFFIPFANFFAIIVLTVDIARNFGKGVGFAFGMLVFNYIFYPILAFGGAKYKPVKPKYLT